MIPIPRNGASCERQNGNAEDELYQAPPGLTVSTASDRCSRPCPRFGRRRNDCRWVLARATYAELPHSDGSGRATLITFTLGHVHPQDLATLLDQSGIAIRSGHHCTQPLHRLLGVDSTARASLYFYNTRAEIDRFIVALQETVEFFRGILAED